jgi:glucose/arabinose dehydrogenase
MRKIVYLLSVMILIYADSTQGQSVPTGFSISPVASGWSLPVGAIFTNDGQRLFIWEKGGKVFVCKRDVSGNYIKQATPVLDISPEVGNWRDHGLLGFALDPNYSSNGLIYLLYVVDRHYLMNFGTASYNAATNQYTTATIGRITRYQTAINASQEVIANTGSRTILVGETRSTGIPILHESHGVGGLAFAADGTLLASAGDGASYNTTDSGSIDHTYYTQALTDGIIRAEENVGAFRSQLLNSHNGKLLRIDPTNGNGVSSNPFYDATTPRSAKSRVWALGFRNPFRISVRPGTGSGNPLAGDIGEVYVGDVGWNLFEETNIVTNGGMNCGWPLFEGITPMNSYALRTTLNRDEPNPLAGGACPSFFMFKNLLKQATADNIKTVYNPCSPTVAIGNGNRYFHRRPSIDWKHGVDSARLPVFVGNNSGVAQIGTTPSGAAGTAFRGNCSVGGCWYTGDLFPQTYKNTFFQGDLGGKWIRSITVNFTDVVTNVVDFGSGFTDLASIAVNPLDGSLITVEVGNGVKKISFGGNQLPVARLGSNKTYGPTSLPVSFTGNTSSDPDGTITGYQWNFGDGSPVSTASNPSHTFTAPAGTPKRYAVALTVTDNAGGQSTDSIIISVNNTPPVVNITSPVKNSYYRLGSDSLYSCTAAVTDAEHTSSQLKYSWQTFLRHNNHEHPEPIDTNRITQALISRIGCNGDDYYWFFRLTVTDGAGLSTTDSAKIYPPCAGGSLPLVLRKFSVTPKGNENLVKWVTEAAYELEAFEIERSVDSRNFISINRQTAINGTSIKEYSYPDNSFPSGTNYYRLKMIEIDHTVRYSAIIKVSSEGKPESLVISPNPVIGNFAIRYNATEQGSVVIRINDMSGKLINTINETVSRGPNIIYVQNEPIWKPGMYVVSIQQGEVMQQGKFIKAE